ncbi:hypothetical protein QBC37DRAFT_297635 [Rhypophila decipiens]|uniref:GED domain-containing protein n=1 Tax=Rhypophila decipiens TaxID=261697 RepID=A0AAN6XYK3_9PEZI|nr:hypothetical protein QBC37DRAFT_297635 [Rhypophila decipiens]
MGGGLLEKQGELLDALSQLQQMGLTKPVQLPQLIVVSNRPVDKSVVLEAFFGRLFSKEEYREASCPTELVCYRHDTEKAKVTFRDQVIYQASLTDKDLHMPTELWNAIKTAKSQSDGSTTNGAEPVNTDEVVRVELSGCVPDLTVIDLPSFDGVNLEATTVILDKYLSRPNSVILAVVSAQEPLEGHPILNLIERKDPDGTRTLGVITTPSIPDWDQGKCLQLANAYCSQTMMWHVLFDRPKFENGWTKELRDEQEQRFTRSGAWLSIPPHNRGIEAFRQKLAAVVLQQTEKSVAPLVGQLQELIDLHQRRLAVLGEERSTVAQMRAYLATIATRFQLIASQSIQGHYDNSFFGTSVLEGESTRAYTRNRTKRLRSLVRDLNRVFLSVLVTKGRRFEIDWTGQQNSAGEVNGKTFTDDDLLPEHLKPLLNLYAVQTPTRVTVEELALSINNGDKATNPSSEVEPLALFRTQIEPWRAIADRHTNLCLLSAKSLAEQLMAHLVADARVAGHLSTRYIVPFFAGKENILREKVSELLKHYTSGYVDFRRLDEDKGPLNGVDGGPDPLAPWPIAKQAFRNMLVYYQKSRTVFADNVAILAVENCLLCHLPAILSPEIVSKMSDEMVKEIASESVFDQEERKELQSRLAKLVKVLETCRAYGPQERIGTSAASNTGQPE